jgi:hypothetical protein
MSTKHYTRTLTIVVAVLLVAAACHDKDGRHWPRSSGTSTVIYVDTSRVSGHIRGLMQYGADVWNVSPRLDIRVRRSCPTTNCITVHQEPSSRRTAATKMRFGSESGHYTAGSITWRGNWSTANLGYAAYAACHELGHALGFSHFGDEDWPCEQSTLRPTRHELESIAAIYGHTDSSGPPGS